METWNTGIDVQKVISNSLNNYFLKLVCKDGGFENMGIFSFFKRTRSKQSLLSDININAENLEHGIENLPKYLPMGVYNCYESQSEALTIYRQLVDNSWLFPGAIVELRGPHDENDKLIQYPWWCVVYCYNDRSWVNRKYLRERFPRPRPGEQDACDYTGVNLNNVRSRAYARFTGPELKIVMEGHRIAASYGIKLDIRCPKCNSPQGPIGANAVNPHNGSLWLCTSCRSSILLTQAIFDGYTDSGISNRFRQAMFITQA